MRLVMFALLALVLATGGQAENSAPATQLEQQAPQIDYAGFAVLTEEVAQLRQERLLPKDAFFERAAAEGALLLDTRSAAAFATGHIEGAVNLPFSDFTDDKLAEVIGEDRDRAIYIYCNNNFSDNAFPIALKKAPLALNIPTFINLVGYGYENVWELGEEVSVSDINWSSDGTIAPQLSK
ncbi:MAG: rhodanese-like domain-containing protein [Pseudomonadota bacterium]